MPESLCARLWLLGVRGVCRYADLARYDGRPLSSLSVCPSLAPFPQLCEGPCPTCTAELHQPCTGRSPDHLQGFCFSPLWTWCAHDGEKYVQPCPEKSLCGVFRVSLADSAVARMHGQCMAPHHCLALSTHLPGGFDCYDGEGDLVVE